MTETAIATRTLTTSKGRSVQTSLTDSQAARICAEKPSDFARDLAGRYEAGRALSMDQQAWLHILAVGDRPAKVVVEIGDVKPMLALFDDAGRKLKFPKLSIETASGQNVRISKAGQRAQFPGSLNVTDGEGFGDNKWFGRVHTDGRFEQGKDCTPEIVALLIEFAQRPAEMAASHGHKTGRCCFCNIKLSDERSTAVGYGETCSKNWKMPWGKLPVVQG